MRRQKRTPPPKRSKLKEVSMFLVLLLLTLGMVARPLSHGALFYQNYRGEAVFVPFVLFVAAILVVAAVINLKRK
jgi:hypothetical protein